MERQRSCSELTGHVVICNVNEKVRAVVEELWCLPDAEPLDVVLIVQDEDLWQRHPDWHPQASVEGRLEIFQELTAVNEELTGVTGEASDVGVALFNRRVENTVVVADGETVVVGGLISNNYQDAQRLVDRQVVQQEGEALVRDGLRLARRQRVRQRRTSGGCRRAEGESGEERDGSPENGAGPSTVASRDHVPP